MQDRLRLIPWCLSSFKQLLSKWCSSASFLILKLLQRNCRGLRADKTLTFYCIVSSQCMFACRRRWLGLPNILLLPATPHFIPPRLCPRPSWRHRYSSSTVLWYFFWSFYSWLSRSRFIHQRSKNAIYGESNVFRIDFILQIDLSSSFINTYDKVFKNTEYSKSTVPYDSGCEPKNS